MRSLAILFPRLLRDRLLRSVVATALVLLLTSPLLRTGDSGFSDGYMVGGEPGAASTANLVGLLLALAAPWLAEGIVSDLRRTGSGPLLLTRPIFRPGFYLARWLAGLVCLVGVAIGTAALINTVWNGRGGSGPGLSLAGSIGAGLVIWVWVGSTVVLLSAVLDRGEALAGTLLVAIPIALTAALPPTDLLVGAARVLPVRPMLSAARALLAGDLPESSGLLSAGSWGLAMLGIGLLVASRRDWRAGY
jgi:ABC-type transport system involved in multi-copper enzyme maturation permease subunit